MPETEVVAELAPQRQSVKPDVGKAIDIWSEPDRVFLAGPDDGRYGAWVALLPEEAHELSACIVKGEGSAEFEAPTNGTKIRVVVTPRRVVLTLKPGGLPAVAADFRPVTAVQLNNAILEHAIAAGWREPPPPELRALAAPAEPATTQELSLGQKLLEFFRI